jgi:hypothetical protein
MLAGCAQQSDGKPGSEAVSAGQTQHLRDQAGFETLAFSPQAVGNVVPVFVALDCRGCDRGYFVGGKDVRAVNESGQAVETMSLDEAVSSAGGAENLCSALTSRADWTVIGGTLLRLFVGGAQATAGPGPGAGLGAFAALPFGAAYSGYLYSDREAMQLAKLSWIVLSDNPFDHTMAVNHGWVFFPAGSYQKIRLTVWGFVPERAEVDEVDVPLIMLAPGAAQELGDKFQTDARFRGMIP